MEIYELSLVELRDKLDKKEISSVEATRACLARIASTDKTYNNFITVCEDYALAAAKKADERIAKGERAPLLGVPVAVKDNIAVKGVRTTCASKFLENFIPPYNATVSQKLIDGGAVILGKTNMDEFAMGSTNENSAFGAVNNALDTSRVPGGSSGGSANAVCAKQAFAALGSDTGGSIRQPAAYCGVVGFKPTYSAVSRNGLVAFASSLDQIGPLARSADDAFELFKTIVGRDSMDNTSLDPPVLQDRLSCEIKGKTVGVAEEFIKGLSDEAAAVFDKAVEYIKSRGAKIKSVSLGAFDAALAVYYVLSSAEAASNLARYDGVKYGKRAKTYKDITELYVNSRTQYFGDEVKRRIMIGNYVLSSGYYDAYYLKASKIRTVIKAEYDAALGDCDVLLSPATPDVAPKHGAQSDPSRVYFSDIYTVPVNIAGLPAASVPFGKVSSMPFGVQVIGRAGDDYKVLSFAKAFENQARGLKA